MPLVLGLGLFRLEHCGVTILPFPNHVFSRMGVGKKKNKRDVQ